MCFLRLRDALDNPVCYAREELVRSFCAHFPFEELDRPERVSLCLQDRKMRAELLKRLDKIEIDRRGNLIDEGLIEPIHRRLSDATATVDAPICDRASSVAPHG